MNFLKNHQSKFLFALVGLLFLGFSFLVLNRLGVHPYIDWDESIYAQVAKEAWQNKSFFNLTYFGNAWYEKPPLAFWMISVSYAVLGINELAARIPTALFALASVALSLRWVYEIRKSYVAVILVLAGFFISFPFITASYFLNLDTIVGFFVLLALYSWWRAQQNAKWFWMFGLAIGLGVMTKSVVGLFPIVPVVIYCILQKDFGFLKMKRFLQGVGLAALIILPWHAYQTIAAGKAFWQNYLIYHVFNRFSTSLENNGQSFWYFFQIVFQRYAIAMAVFGVGILVAAVIARKDKAVRFIFISAIVLFLIFSISTTKLPSYITMTLPLIVMLAGISMQWLTSFAPRKWMQSLVVVVLFAAFAYTGYNFNVYKLAQGEYAEEYLSNQKVGWFLKDYRRDLQVYVNEDYKSLGIGYYAERKLTPTEDKALIDGATERVYHRRDQEVFLGKNEKGEEYLMVKKY